MSTQDGDRARLATSATCGGARTGTVQTPRGTFATPCFMPVGTRGAVRTLSSVDLEDIGAEVVLANTYHLMLRPGADVVARAGGLHRFASWEGHLLTDSGGYQVFSLSPDVDDGGVTFRSVYDGSQCRLTPEAAVAVQEDLGADIQMALDVCPPLPSPPEVLRTAVRRTAEWARRARASHRRADQAIFGIVQGGTDRALRIESAHRTVDLDFDGYGVGGLSVGEHRPAMLEALEAAVAELPRDRPRYLMGVGDPHGIVEAVSLGIDMFDSVLPTRLGRHGTVLTSEGRLNLRNAAHLGDHGPLDAGCSCSTCARFSRSYLAHLLRVEEPTAPRLVTIHNLSWVLDLVAQVRAAVAAGSLDSLRRDVASIWSARPLRGDDHEG